jgi:hypothetical protein
MKYIYIYNFKTKMHLKINKYRHMKKYELYYF